MLTGAGYSVSAAATKRVMFDGPDTTMKLVNASSPSEVIFGSSTTILVENLARTMEADVLDGEELVISFADHEGQPGLPAHRSNYWSSEIFFFG